MSIVLAAGSGGHLAELVSLESRIELSGDRIWVTDRTAQSETLLQGKDVLFVPHTKPRDVCGVAAVIPRLHSLVRERNVEYAVSTGAGIALALRAAITATGAKFSYIESVTRVDDISMTGKVLSLVPKTHLLTQFESAAKGRWKYVGSVFDGFRIQDSQVRRTKIPENLQILVVVGANQEVGFRRMVEAVLKISRPQWRIIWQVGPTDTSGLHIDGHMSFTSDEMKRFYRQSDVIVCHAGTGSVLDALEAGKVPIVFPRLSRLNEHVDDHQVEFSSFAERKGIAVVVSNREMTYKDILTALNQTSYQNVTAPPIVLP